MNIIDAVPPGALNPDHPDAAYWTAWLLLTALDRRLTGGQHLRATDGQLIVSLDQLVPAILDNRWPVEATE